jgi:cytoskeleton protein RodZ
MSLESDLGSYLRRHRERSGLSVDAVATGSRIVPRLVDALEAGRHDLLPAPVYVRGFIRAYCQQEGADPERALQLYDANGIPDPALAIPPRRAAPPREPGGGRWRRAAAGSLLVAVLGAALVVLLTRRQPDAAAGRGSGPRMTAVRAPTTPGPAAPASPSPAETTDSAGTTSPPVPPAPATPVPVERILLMRAVETTWVRVTPDGARPTEETLAPGAVREWRSPGRFHVTVGNAGGVEIELDGRALPALGGHGQVVRDATIPSERP